MSTLRMSCPYVGTVDVKVISFNSTVQGSFGSSQTKTMRHHWPVKASQQSLSLNIQFRNWYEYNQMQEYVRAHHLRSLLTVQYPEVTLYWPQRNIDNWTGLINKMEAGDERFNIAPRTTLNITLIDSMLSEKTFTSSMGESTAKWWETDIGNPDPNNPFKPPSTAKPPDVAAPANPNISPFG